jgi:hypothetical protein
MITVMTALILILVPYDHCHDSSILIAVMAVIIWYLGVTNIRIRAVMAVIIWYLGVTNIRIELSWQ